MLAQRPAATRGAPWSMAYRPTKNSIYTKYHICSAVSKARPNQLRRTHLGTEGAVPGGKPGVRQEGRHQREEAPLNVDADEAGGETPPLDRQALRGHSSEDHDRHPHAPELLA